MNTEERNRVRGPYRSKALHDNHVVAYWRHFKALARNIDAGLRKAAREADRRANLLAAGIPLEANPNRKKKLKRKYAIERATPPWADLDAIAAKYAHARRLTEERGEPWGVDHYVPLRNPLVCGLHVSWNLDPMRRDVNSLKGNKVWLDMP